MTSRSALVMLATMRPLRASLETGPVRMLVVLLAMGMLASGGPSLVVCATADGAVSLEFAHLESDHHHDHPDGHEGSADEHEHDQDHDHHHDHAGSSVADWLGHHHGCFDRSVSSEAMRDALRAHVDAPVTLARALRSVVQPPRLARQNTPAASLGPLAPPFHRRTVVQLI